MKNETPCVSLFVGDLNCHCQQWWPLGDSNKDGIAMENLTSNLDLTQLITEPTNFQENSSPSCIDLMFCDQPNIVIESGTRHSLEPHWRH